uniref:Uncharacterized protein n=1 Tax=Plectus sambesii TaxID=2011161 RepID=A0A914WKW9_9BILA
MSPAVLWAIAIIFAVKSDASLLCPTTTAPTETTFLRTLVVYKSNDIYRLSPDCLSTSGFSPLMTSGIGRVAISDMSHCPLSSCMFELATNQKVADSNILHQDNFVAGIVPAGFAALNTKSKMYCVRVKGDCGADLPIWRYTKSAGKDGLLYAYSLDGSVVYTGYAKEATPICYAWSTSSCGEGIPSDKLAILSTYVNNFQGPFRDHFITTWSPYTFDPMVSTSLMGYKKVKDLAKVAIAQSAGSDILKCNCLVKAVQMFDNQPGVGGSSLSPGLFGRFDHKFILADGEANLPSEGYEQTGEIIYCVREKGVCGATVPLKKWFNGFEIDTFYTIEGEADPLMVRNDGILCYVWPLNYAPPGTFNTC